MNGAVIVEHQDEAQIFEGFAEQFNKQVGADVRFKMEDGRVIYAHRVVLTSRSAFFSNMFHEKWKDTQPIILAEMAEESIDSDSFYSLLHYVYKGRLDESMFQDSLNLWKKVLELLNTSHHYGQMDLFTECKNILLSKVTVENACAIFQVANQLQIQDLEERTLKFMAPPNFCKIIQSDALPAGFDKLIAQKLLASGIDHKGIREALEASGLDDLGTQTGEQVQLLPTIEK